MSVEFKPKGTLYTYHNYFTDRRENYVLGNLDQDDDTILVIVTNRDTGQLLEWFTDAHYRETVRNFATDGNLVVLDSAKDHEVVKWAIAAHEEYNDCFGLD